AAGQDQLAAVNLDSQTLCVRVASVPDRPLTLLVCHGAVHSCPANRESPPVVAGGLCIPCNIKSIGIGGPPVCPASLILGRGWLECGCYHRRGAIDPLVWPNEAN